MQVRSQRSLTKLRDELLERPIEAATPALNTLKDRIDEADASVSILPGVKELLDESKELVAGAKFYTAVANCLVNLIVKPARRWPADQLKTDLKACIVGCATAGYWVEPEDEASIRVEGSTDGQPVNVVPSPASLNILSRDLTCCVSLDSNFDRPCLAFGMSSFCFMLFMFTVYIDMSFSRSVSSVGPFSICIRAGRQILLAF